jgi:hypothetical protein
MAPRNACQRRFLCGFAVLILAAVIAWLGSIAVDRFDLLATNHRANRLPVATFRVAGSSMVPALYGPTLQIRCAACRHEMLFDAQSLSRDRGDLICSLCGQRHDLADDELLSSLQTYPGDVVHVSEVPTAEYRIGDLVALDRHGKMQVKRIAAVAGNILDVDGLHLLVDGRRLEDRMAGDANVSPPPSMTIDDDSFRAESRWAAADEGGGWIRQPNRRWRAEADSSWLIYHHRNVHDHNRPSGVMDDYQYNAGVARRLEGVDRLSITGTLTRAGTLTGDSGATIQVAFWSGSGDVLAAQHIDHGASFEVSFADGSPAENLPVREEQPVAIRIAAGGAALESLSVKRAVEYRLNPQHDRRDYPLRIPAGHCFVVGDNVPFSVDSRSWGPVEFGQLGGRVQRVESIEANGAWSP